MEYSTILQDFTKSFAAKHGLHEWEALLQVQIAHYVDDIDHNFKKKSFETICKVVMEIYLDESYLEIVDITDTIMGDPIGWLRKLNKNTNKGTIELTKASKLTRCNREY